MEFQIRKAESNEDWDFFFKLGYETAKVLRQFVLDSLMKDNPDAPDDEIFKLYRKETEDYYDFEHPDARVFIAENKDWERCGYLWMGMRNSKDVWDVETPQWIYDIVVDPTFRGHGLGRKLMEKGEEFSKKLNLNLGLFVHSDNIPAVTLYKKMGYKTKQIPTSKTFRHDSQAISLGDEFTIREIQDNEYESIVETEFDRFKKKIEFSSNVDTAVAKKLHHEFLEKYFNDEEKHQRFIALAKDDGIIGTIWVGSSGFNKLVAMIHEITIDEQYQSDEIADYLVNSAENWARKEKFPTIYMLLHSNDSVDVDLFKERGYKVPGFFMEKRLK